MTRPTCATCAHWQGEHAPPIPKMRQCQSPIRAPWMPESGRVWCGSKMTCPHHTPTARDAGTEDDRELR